MGFALRRWQWMVPVGVALSGCFSEPDVGSGDGAEGSDTGAAPTESSSAEMAPSGSTSGVPTSSSADASTSDGVATSSDSASGSSGANELALVPFALTVDPDGNDVLDLGEDVVLQPRWRDETEAGGDAVGTLDMFGDGSDATCDVLDDAALYTFVDAEPTTCTDCYVVRIDLEPDAARPSGDWDVTATEMLDSGDEHEWTLHVGPTFPDVSPSSLYYRDIETLVHYGITQGTVEGTFEPGDSINRDAAAQLVANAHVGDGELPTSGDVPGLGAYDCAAGGTSVFADVAPGSVHCAAVHYIASLGISVPCVDGATSFCALTSIERWQLAVFVARAVAPDSVVPSDYLDPDTNRAYDCNTAAPLLHYGDVPATHPGCAAIHYLWARGAEDECAAATFCPDLNITRAQTARFIARGFALDLYAP